MNPGEHAAVAGDEHALAEVHAVTTGVLDNLDLLIGDASHVALSLFAPAHRMEHTETL
ncbi:hypothetical protein ACIP5Y_24580 [Nocardia sp. NPDC088792]|uniref:hypothetical protein n=1 Tax=Nocardia sp. NPDC088792 TaxID=3364332 RepID=UPI0038112E93